MVSSNAYFCLSSTLHNLFREVTSPLSLFIVCYVQVDSLRGCVTLLEIGFIGHLFFPLGREAHRSTNGVRILKKMSIFLLTTPLRGEVSLLEIVFVGQCEVFVCR